MYYVVNKNMTITVYQNMFYFLYLNLTSLRSFYIRTSLSFILIQTWKVVFNPNKKIHHRVRLSIQCKLPDGNNEPATFFCNMQMKKPIGLVQKGWMQCYEEKTRDKKVIKP